MPARQCIHEWRPDHPELTSETNGLSRTLLRPFASALHFVSNAQRVNVYSRTPRAFHSVADFSAPREVGGVTGILVFSLTLFVALLFSELAKKSILSTSVIFLVVGFFVGEGMFSFLHLEPSSPLVSTLADIALFTVLFTDGMKAGWKELSSAWHLPGRALLFGLPLTLLINAFLAHSLAGLSWLESFLVGAALSPTDPVFAAAIVGRKEIPHRLRHLLNVESGLNDGLALPFVVALLAVLGRNHIGWASMGTELLGGIVLGVAVAWLAIVIERRRFFSVEKSCMPLFALSIALMVFSIAGLTHANEYLAAFSAGAAIATVWPVLQERFSDFGELLTEFLKLAAILVFGALLSPRWFSEISFGDVLFTLLALFVARPLSLWLALIGAGLDWKEKIAAYWFGPKGFASIVYGLLILKSGIPNADHLFHLIALVVTASIIAHSSTDVVVARWFHQKTSGDKLQEPAR